MINSNLVLFEYFLDYKQKRIILFIIRPDFVEPKIINIDKDPSDIRDYIKKEFKHLINSSPNLSLHELSSISKEFHNNLSCIVAPIFAWINEGEIVWIVPHDILHSIPIHAIESNGRTVIENNPVFYTPSSSILKFCKDKKRNIKSKSLIFGDSLLNKPLPHARIEAIVLADFFQNKPFIGIEATKSRFIEEISSSNMEINIIHICCHGRFISNNPLESGVFFSGQDINNIEGERGNPCLTAKDIFGLKMPVNLITLSACETGVSELTSGDELIGIVRALIYAGASSIVASLWKVNDFSTFLLMERFYSLLMLHDPPENEKRMTKVVALQKAQLYVKNIRAQQLLEIFDEKSTKFENYKDLWLYFLYGKGMAQKFANDHGAANDTFQFILNNLNMTSHYWQVILKNEIDKNCKNMENSKYSIDYSIMPFSHFSFWAPFILIGDWN